MRFTLTSVSRRSIHSGRVPDLQSHGRLSANYRYSMKVQFHLSVYTDHLHWPGKRQTIKKDWVSSFVESPTEDGLRDAVRAKIPKLKALHFDEGLVWEGSVNIGTFTMKLNQPAGERE